MDLSKPDAWGRVRQRCWESQLSIRNKELLAGNVAGHLSLNVFSACFLRSWKLQHTLHTPCWVLSKQGLKWDLLVLGETWTSLPFFLLVLPTFSTASNYNHSISSPSRDSWGLPEAKEWEVEEEEWRHVMDAGCKELGTSSSILGKAWKAANFRHRFREDLENVVHILLMLKLKEYLQYCWQVHRLLCTHWLVALMGWTRG